MSDDSGLGLDDGDASGGDSSPKKSSGGLGALLPNILKFVAIGLGALVFIITVAVITFNIMNKGGKPQTGTIDPTNPYIGVRPQYAMYTMLGPVTTRTKDTVTSYSVTVEMIIGYDLNDNLAQTELVSRQYELRDFVRQYFTKKYAAELQPDFEPKIKQDILEQLNTRFLDKARARVILFNKLDVLEGF